MAPLPRLALLGLALVFTVGTVVSIPRKINRRQAAVDTSGISDSVLFDCLLKTIEGQACSNLAVDNAPGCQCVKHHQCLDNDIPREETSIGGSSINGINLRLVPVSKTCDDPFDICCTNIDLSVTPPQRGKTVGEYIPNCGQLNPLGVDSTMVGFTEKQSQFGQFPWMAAVMNKGIPGAGGENVYVCGGSLIHPRVILTVGHNVDDKLAKDLVVRLGEWNFKAPSEPILHQDIQVERIVLHPGYRRNELQNDVALLFLQEDAILGPTVDTICLPEPSDIFDGESCYASGWGKDVFDQQGQYQQILKSLTLPVVNHGQCQSAYRGTRLTSQFVLHDSFMCAGGEADDTCTGDGGSPLVCRMKSDPTRYVQAGAVAWGIGCGTKGLPGVYASVGSAVPWIKSMLPKQRRPLIQGIDLKFALPSNG